MFRMLIVFNYCTNRSWTWSGRVRFRSERQMEDTSSFWRSGMGEYYQCFTWRNWLSIIKIGSTFLLQYLGVLSLCDVTYNSYLYYFYASRVGELAVKREMGYLLIKRKETFWLGFIYFREINQCQIARTINGSKNMPLYNVYYVYIF